MEGYTEIFSWGLNNSGQLGLGVSNKEKSQPCPIFCSFNILIKDISCGEDHSGFISDSGHIYCMGSNSKGKLGIGDKQKLYTNSPCLVEGLSSYSAIKLSCGWSSTAAITSNGLLFTWGNGEFGALGTGNLEDQWSPVQIASNINDISCGSRHMAVISNKVLYTCGNGEMGQLGTGKRQSEACLCKIKSENVIQVSCGIFHTGFISENGFVYTMGSNSYGQLGTGNKSNSLLPKKVNISDAIKIFCGYCSLCITNDGLYTWGSSVFGEILTPKKIQISAWPIIDVAIGGCFCLAVDSKSNLFAWGSNSNGELGTGDFDKKISHVAVSALKGKKIKKIAAGTNFVICLGLSNRERKEKKAFTAREKRDCEYSNPATSRNLKSETSKDIIFSRFVKENSPNVEKSKVRGENSVFLKVDEDIKSILKTEENNESRVNNDEKNKNCLETSLRSENSFLREEINRLKTEVEKHRERENEIEKIKENYSKQIENLKTDSENQEIYQKELEKDLEIAISHTKRLEHCLSQAKKEKSDNTFYSSSEFSQKIVYLEEETSRLNQIILNSDNRNKDLQETIEKTKKDLSNSSDFIENLEQQIQKFHEYIQELTKSIENLNNIIKDQERVIITIKKENSYLQNELFSLQTKNKQLVQTFEREVSQKAKEFTNKAKNILSFQKLTPTKPIIKEKTEENLQITNRKELSDRQHVKIQNAVNKILENKDSESPGKKNFLNNTFSISPYKPLSEENSGITLSKADVKSKISVLMQNRSRIEKKLQLLQSEQEIL